MSEGEQTFARLQTQNNMPHRFYTPLGQLKPGIRIYLSEKESLHITKSLRLQKGEEVEIFNGAELFRAQIVSTERTSVRVKLLDRLEVAEEHESGKLALYLAAIKYPRFELAVKKSIEVGATQVTPFLAAYSNTPLVVFEKKQKRMQQLAIEVCKQSERTVIPAINDPIDFQSMVGDLREFDKVLVFTTQDEPTSQLLSVKVSTEQDIACVIGPEGGFNADELAAFSELPNAQFVTLGHNILRAETAAIVAVAGVSMLLQASS